MAADNRVMPDLELTPLAGKCQLFRINGFSSRRNGTARVTRAFEYDGSGDISDWRVGVLWQFSQHLGLGLHYRNFDIQVDSTSNSHPGALNLTYKGAQLAFRASL